MARHARKVLGVRADDIEIEPAARSTWQNIKFSAPLMEEADYIKIASDPLHAARARQYLEKLRPDLAARVVPTHDYELFERWWLKVPTAVYELYLAARRSLAEKVIFEL